MLNSWYGRKLVPRLNLKSWQDRQSLIHIIIFTRDATKCICILWILPWQIHCILHLNLMTSHLVIKESNGWIPKCNTWKVKIGTKFIIRVRVFFHVGSVFLRYSCFADGTLRLLMSRWFLRITNEMKMIKRIFLTNFM